jgi:hypothetical protein
MVYIFKNIKSITVYKWAATVSQELNSCIYIVIDEIYLNCNWADLFTLYLSRYIYIVIEQMYSYCIWIDVFIS